MTVKVWGDDGETTDWFFMYKLPSGATDPTGRSDKTSTGTEYLYFDSRSTHPIFRRVHHVQR